MKAKVISVVSILLIMCFSGCSNSENAIDKTSDIQMITLSELSVNAESANDTLALYSNLKISENIYIDTPKNITQVYEYTSTVPLNVDMKKYYDDFKVMFEYLFPNHKLDENYLLYRGGSSDIEYNDDGTRSRDYNKVKDWEEKILSGKEGCVNFLYDEAWYQDMIEWKSPVCLELGNPVGYGYTVINKGKTIELSESKLFDENLNTERYPTLNSYDPADWLEYVETYSRDSTQSFKLADKEMPINEAVDFFEKYINELPCPEDVNAKTVVIDVDVYEITENIYGYYFLTTKEYQGVKFDHMRSGTQHSKFDDYSATGGNAFMAESDDVDVVYGYYRLEENTLGKSYKDIVDFETAAQIISEKMTNSIVFDVQKIELVYTNKPSKTEEGFIDIVNPSSEIAPAWKFTLCNLNDTMLYVCYIDAIDGQNFRYYTSPK